MVSRGQASFLKGLFVTKSDVDEFNAKKKLFENLKKLNECIDQANEKNPDSAETMQANW